MRMAGDGNLLFQTWHCYWKTVRWGKEPCGWYLRTYISYMYVWERKNFYT